MKGEQNMTVGILYGGKSSEHDVSCLSAEFVSHNLSSLGYQVSKIKVDMNNQFDLELIKSVEVVFPIIHGAYGEDGSLQGMLEMLGKPYVGAGVLGSAVGMDKDVQKRLLMQAGITVARYISLKLGQNMNELYIPFDFPIFVKPANGGSSVGVTKVNGKSRLKLFRSIEKAFEYDTKVLIEEAIIGREIEVAVLGDSWAGFRVEASLPGEIIPAGKHEFYDYEAKYKDEKGAVLLIPADDLSPSTTGKIQKLAVKIFEVLDCSGMARVDMFLCSDGRLVVNEINTLPGFTKISMYPKLWEVSGMTETKLLDRLIKMAVRKWKVKESLRRDYY